jgi:hypothetical protein
MSGLGTSPGDLAKSRKAAACVGPVKDIERGWETRGVQPRSLARAWSWVMVRVYPRGQQVG